MGRLLLLVRKDLLRQRRSPLWLIFVLAFPVVFSGLIAMTFGGGQQGLPRVLLLVEDRDRSLISGLLVAASAHEELARYFDVRPAGDDGIERLERGQASALLRIPEGFGDDLLRGRPTELQLIRNPAQGILPEIAEQALTVVVDGLSTASHLMREPLDRILVAAETDGGSLDIEQLTAISVAFDRTLRRSGSLLLPPVVWVESAPRTTEADGAAEAARSTTAQIFLMVLPGISVWAVFLIGDMGMRDLLLESVAGTLRRQLYGPLPVWQLVAGKALFSGTLALIGLAILSFIGWLATGQGADPFGFVLLSLALILAVTGYASLVYGLARTVRQGSTISSLLLLLFAFVGGSFVRVDSLPSTLKRFAPISPFYWGTTGFESLIREGAGAGAILLNVGVLSVLGLALLAIGSRLLGRKVRQGVDL